MNNRAPAVVVGKCSSTRAVLEDAIRAARALCLLWSGGRPAAAWIEAQSAGAPSVTETMFGLPGGAGMPMPSPFRTATTAHRPNPRPLVLALHPGGGGCYYYGGWFMQALVEPALREWGAVIVAPDVPGRSWSSPDSERAVLALLDDVVVQIRGRRRPGAGDWLQRGGAGVWYLATRQSRALHGRDRDRRAASRREHRGTRELPFLHDPQPGRRSRPLRAGGGGRCLLTERGYPVRLRSVPGLQPLLDRELCGPPPDGGEWMMAQWQAGAPRPPTVAAAPRISSPRTAARRTLGSDGRSVTGPCEETA